MPWKGIGVAIAVIVAFLIVLGRASGVVVDWAWFSSIGYVGVFWTIFATKAVLFTAVFAVSTLLFWVNGTLALRLASQRRLRLPAALDPGSPTAWARPETPTELFRLVSPLLPWRLLILAVALIIGLLIAIGETGEWDLVLRFIHQVPYGQNDPLFDKDIGFYLFSLPVYVALKNWLMWLLILSALMAGGVYFVHGAINLDRRPWHISSAAIGHGSALLGLYFALKAWSYALDRYLLLYNDNGIVVGAGYTDVHVELPVLWLLIGLAAAAAVLAWANVRLGTYKLPIAAAALVFGGSFVFAGILPALFQRFSVKPSELQLEAPYIQRNITLTREAYNLQQITVKPFPVEQGLSFQSLQDNRGTIDNIRLWDWQPLMDTYAQLQEIRTYYKFLDVDIDRYQIDGSNQQVTLAARELEPALLAANAQTWVNLHLLFTHGTGVVMSPVTQKSAEGLPVFYLKDIPTVASGGPRLTEPRIYFGQGAGAYVIVKGSTPEFDYPKGKDNVYATYDGADGIAIGGTAWKTLFAWYFDDVNILLSRYITGGSRILLHRNIQDRVRTIAPFLQLDRDPYVVVSDGQLYWMQDAYTTSRWFPYAQPQPDGGTNYIRNSVKVVIDAYNGTVAFYVADATDPVIATYRRIFPALFKPFDAMPPDLQKHIRYPEDLFRIQALQYRAYHMDAPEVFYNREDLWQFPREPTAPDGVSGPSGATMAPYYIMMRLPGDPRAEFFLMLPMVPSQRENMIAWLAARCDPPDYGKLIVYEFPKDKLVYGPFQIEARINQNTDISRQLSLWNQMGSRVIRGNLLVVPIESSILYVSPLYLRAESGQLPELKRVIAAYGDRVVMEETLPAALAALFKESVPAAPLPVRSGASSSGAVDERARGALGHYDRAIDRLKVGDWSGFGAELDALRPLLEELSQQPPAR
jgi:uncharacterized membrane protein (UPF0182 family)